MYFIAVRRLASHMPSLGVSSLDSGPPSTKAASFYLGSGRLGENGSQEFHDPSRSDAFVGGQDNAQRVDRAARMISQILVRADRL
jgi:hypothetical protein